MKLEVHEGSIGVAVAAAGDSSRFLIERAAPTRPGVQIIDLPIEDAKTAGQLIVRNRSAEGPSRATLLLSEVRGVPRR